MILQCKTCGGDLVISENDSAILVATCENCGNKQALPKANDENRRINLYNRAGHFWRNNEYDKAAGIYEQLLIDDPTDSEIYWSLILCQYGIQYVEDPTTRKRVPTVNRTQFSSVVSNENYKSAIKHANTHQKIIFEEEAKKIDSIQASILEISRKEDPYDIFICYKENDFDNHRTHDSVIAHDLYTDLTKEGYKVFFSRITLEDKLGHAYEPYIFSALNSAKVMLVIGTKPEFFNAPWVKNEWSRYLIHIKNGEDKTLIPAYQNMSPYDLPEEFSHLQGQDMSKIGFKQDLIRGINKIIKVPTEQSSTTIIKETIINQIQGDKNLVTNDSLLERAFMFLEDGQWTSADNYCDKVLDANPKCSRAYMGKLLASLHIKSEKDLPKCTSQICNNPLYVKACKFATKEELERIGDYDKQIVYNIGTSKLNSAKDEKSFKNAATWFQVYPSYKDCKKLYQDCMDRAETARKEAIYIDAKNTKSLTSKIEKFDLIPGYKDADKLKEKAEIDFKESIKNMRKEERNGVFLTFISIILMAIGGIYEYVVTQMYKDIPMYRWIYIPLLVLISIFILSIIGRIMSNNDTYSKILPYLGKIYLIWEIIRAIMIEASYFQAYNGWSLIVPIIGCVPLFLVNLIPAFIAIFIL